MSWIHWAPAGAAVLHIVEEFVYPGGFAAWHRDYQPEIRASITTGWLVFLNALLLVACAGVGLAGPTPRGVAAWLTLAALLFSNGVFHLVGALKTGRYSPGVATGMGLYVPLAIYGYPHFLRSGQASIGTALVSLALGASYPLWSMALHRRRARARRV